MTTSAHPRDSAVVVALNGKQLLAIVSYVTVEPVGKPGAHRYRYMLQPARLVHGQPTAIPAFHRLAYVKHNVIQPYDPAVHQNLSPWRAA